MQTTVQHAHGVGRIAARLRRSRDAPRRPRPVAYVVFVAGLAVFCVTAWPFTRAHLQAFAVLRAVAGQPIPSAVAWVTRVPVATKDLNFPVESAAGQQMVRARLYVPVGRRDPPPLVIFHGVHYLGIDEPRLIGFARAMASCGIEVLTPELPDIKDYHVGASSVRTIGESARWFAQQAGRPQVGVMGLSFSGGLALVAAADPAYRPYFKFVFAVGSQDSMDRVTTYYRTGADVRPDGTTEHLPAHEYGPLVLEYEYLEDFLPGQDVAPVRAVLRAHLYEDKKAEAEASVGLNEVQKRETLALMDASSQETRARIAEVLRKHQADLEGVSPDGHLAHLTTPVYLLHGEADNIIPSAESLWMASELPREELKAMLVSPVLSHIDLDGPSPGPMDEWRLVHFFALVLDATERK